MNNTEAKLLSIVQRRFPGSAPHFALANDFAETGLDSLDFVDLIWEVERTFAVKLSDEDLKSLRAPSDLVKLLERGAQPA